MFSFNIIFRSMQWISSLAQQAKKAHALSLYKITFSENNVLPYWLLPCNHNNKKTLKKIFQNHSFFDFYAISTFCRMYTIYAYHWKHRNMKFSKKNHFKSHKHYSTMAVKQQLSHTYTISILTGCTKHCTKSSSCAVSVDQNCLLHLVLHNINSI